MPIYYSYIYLTHRIAKFRKTSDFCTGTGGKKIYKYRKKKSRGRNRNDQETKLFVYIL